MVVHVADDALPGSQGEVDGAIGGRSVVIAATFTAEPVVAAVAYWMEHYRLNVMVKPAPYGQVLEQVALPDSDLVRAGTDLAVILIRIEDYLRGPASDGRARARVTAHLIELAAAIDAFLEDGGGPLLLGVMPTTEPDPPRGLGEWARRKLRDCLKPHPTALWVDLEEALDLYEVRSIADPLRGEIAHIPYSDECLAAVGTAVARRIRALWGVPRKAIALDCDNTLWAGACSEDPLGELDAEGPYRRLRVFMRQQAETGRLLCLVSRNRPEDVEAAFERYGDPLEGGDIVARRCGWDDKADSLQSLAEELGLDVDSFVFVDDDPLECAEIKERLPGVSVLELPPDPHLIPRTLRHAWELDFAFLTEADRRRSRSYLANRKLSEGLRRSRDAPSFLAGLNVRVSLARARADELPRVVQLFHRTNQFNCTGWRPSSSALKHFASDEKSGIWTVRVVDRLGDYGLVGALLTSRAEAEVRVEQIALSCRVFKRSVERSMLSELFAALDPRPARILIAFRETERNLPARRFLEVHGEEVTRSGTDDTRWFSVGADLSAGKCLDR